MISSLLVEAALRSALLALAVWIGLRVFGVRNVLAQKATWGLVLAGALVMPLVLPMASHWTVLPANVRVVLPADPQTLLEELQARIQAKPSSEQKPQPEATAPGEGAPQAELQAGPLVNEPGGNRVATSAEPGYLDPDAVENPTESVAPRPAVAPRAALSLSKIILMVYLAVAGILLVRLGCGLIAALRLWRRAKLIPGETLTVPGPSVGLRCSAEVSSPVTICSTIVLPVDYTTWDSEKLRVVLAHERSHIRQGDFYLQVVSAIYAAAFWPSPLGWWLKSKLSDLAEAISDRAGLEEAADRTSYAQILLEFAAAPRPILIGVAMANRGSLSRRIERLLNDVSFRQAFAGTRRALAAVLVVPVVLFAATVLVRVQAAGQQAPEPPAPAVAPTGGVPAPEAVAAPEAPFAGVSNPEQISDESVPAPPAVTPVAPPPQAGVPESDEPVPPAAPRVLTIAPLAPPAGPAHLTILPAVPAKGTLTLIAPKAPGTAGNASLIIVPPNVPTMAIIGPRAGFGEGHGFGIGQSATTEGGSSSYSSNGRRSGYHYSYSSNGESYAVIRGSDTEHVTFSGNWIEGRREEIEKARKQAGGKDFLWFTRDGKSYFVDDPTVLSQIEAMYKPMEELGEQQEVLGKQQEALGKQQEELGRKQEGASVPTPDMSKEIAKIDEAMAKLKASQGKNMTQDQFGDLQEKLGELQARLGEIQGQIGEKQGAFGAQMGELGEKMGALGAQQGRLGAEQGRIAREADLKVKAIIDESMKNGKAHPVQ